MKYFLQVSIRTMSNAECTAGLFGWVESQVSDNMICISGFKRGICNGDSGGPLVIQEPGHSYWSIIGVTSWGSALECGLKKPSVFARVSSQLDWIRARVSGTTCPHPS